MGKPRAVEARVSLKHCEEEERRRSRCPYLEGEALGQLATLSFFQKFPNALYLMVHSFLMAFL